MKPTSYKILLILLLMLGAAMPAMAQWRESFAPEPMPDVLTPEPRRWFFGLFGGLNLNEHPGTFKPDSCAECIFSDGSGKGAFFGLQIEYKPRPFIGLSVKAAFDDKRADYSRPLPGRKRVVIDATTGQTDSNVVLDFERTSTVYLSYFMINPMVELFPVKNLYVMGGVAFGFPIRKNYQIKERVLDPNFTFRETGTNELTVRDAATAEVLDVKSRIDARVGAGYNIPLSPMVSLSPEVIYEFPLSTITSAAGWEAKSLHLLAVLKLTL
jgi:hypothetical protein